ncbi:MOSC domain-containing protein [Pseudomonas chlororaphis]|uniref:Uncharacterized protein n=1 Tax=Pseudomonas chlororaphis subsp. aurantiaca TaxID=86192 RepID=A0AAJ0ZJE9_9PSED|nr:hypothetical protein [Pseudomonas chlororaphis]MBU4633204.1 hypothetical protein [Pseudomonas chlororaphis subsp. aurantiaca]
MTIARLLVASTGHRKPHADARLISAENLTLKVTGPPGFAGVTKPKTTQVSSVIDTSLEQPWLLRTRNDFDRGEETAFSKETARQPLRQAGPRKHKTPDFSRKSGVLR